MAACGIWCRSSSSSGSVLYIAVRHLIVSKPHIVLYATLSSPNLTSCCTPPYRLQTSHHAVRHRIVSKPHIMLYATLSSPNLTSCCTPPYRLQTSHHAVRHLIISKPHIMLFSAALVRPTKSLFVSCSCPPSVQLHIHFTSLCSSLPIKFPLFNSFLSALLYFD